MPKTTLIEYGTSVIAGAYDDEEIVPALGDNAAIPGDWVEILATRKVAGSKLGGAGSEAMSGILLESRITGREAAIGDGIRCEVVIPKSGHRYNTRCKTSSDGEIGHSLDISDIAGKLDGAADVTHALCSTAKPIGASDTVCQVRMR